MSESNIVRKSADDLGEGRTDWDRLDSLTDEEIEEAAAEDPDQELLAPDWFEQAKLVVPSEKERISIRVDKDVLKQFREKGKGYQTRINAVLKAYVMHDKLKHERK